MRRSITIAPADALCHRDRSCTGTAAHRAIVRAIRCAIAIVRAIRCAIGRALHRAKIWAMTGPFPAPASRPADRHAR
jgi:hypothetical protein